MLSKLCNPLNAKVFGIVAPEVDEYFIKYSVLIPVEIFQLKFLQAIIGIPIPKSTKALRENSLPFEKLVLVSNNCCGIPATVSSTEIICSFEEV